MARTRWLSDEEQAAWRAFLSASQRLFDRLDRQLREDAGLTHADYEILVRLSAADGHRLRMSDLAAQVLFSRSRLSHAVKGLEDAGWVERQQCAADRRGSEAVLTDAGMRALEAAAPGHVEAVRRCVFDPLTAAQVAQLRRIGEAVDAATCEDLRRTSE